MVVTDTIEEICQKYKAKEDTLQALSKILDDKYDDIYDKFNTSIDGYIKKVQLFSFIMCILEYYKPDLYESGPFSPPPKKNTTESTYVLEQIDHIYEKLNRIEQSIIQEKESFETKSKSLFYQFISHHFYLAFSDIFEHSVHITTEEVGNSRSFERDHGRKP